MPFRSLELQNELLIALLMGEKETMAQKDQAQLWNWAREHHLSPKGATRALTLKPTTRCWENIFLLNINFFYES